MRALARRTRWCVVIACLGALLSPPGWAQDVTPAQAPDLTSLRLGAELQRVHSEDRLYVALRDGGVAIVDVRDPSAPKLLGTFAPGRAVSRLVIAQGVAYLIETREEASAWAVSDPANVAPLPLEAALTARSPAAAAGQDDEDGDRRSASASTSPAQASATPPGGAPPATRVPSPRTEVAEVRGGRVIFQAGADEGFTAGMHVRITSQRLESKPDLTTGQMVRVPSDEVTAIVKIEQAEAHRSMARLGRGDVAEPGDVVVPTSEPLSERLLVPRRAPFRFLAGFHARPFLGVDATTQSGSSKPVGLLLDVYGSYYLDAAPVMFSLSAAPIGTSLGSREAHYPATVALTAAYATDYFEIGLGGGMLVGNQGPCYDPLYSGAPGGGAVTCEANTGWTINQVLRLGALDGINVSWRSSIFSRPDRFVFGVGRAEVNVPLTRQVGLFGAGGGGENGWGFGEFGVRTWLGGTGASGTTILSASLGYASIFDGPSHELVGGPSVAFGLEQRF